MKTMFEPQWHKILIQNLNNAIKLCQEAGIKIFDHENDDWQLDYVYYSPAMDAAFFYTKKVEEGKKHGESIA